MCGRKIYFFLVTIQMQAESYKAYKTNALSIGISWKGLQKIPRWYMSVCYLMDNPQ